MSTSSAQNITVHYAGSNHAALSNVSVQIPAARFTAIIGFEWTAIGGDNLHRNVIYRDGEMVTGDEPVAPLDAHGHVLDHDAVVVLLDGPDPGPPRQTRRASQQHQRSFRQAEWTPRPW